MEDFNSLGYITYSDRGYMAVNVMPLDREPFADDGSPTPEEVQVALQGYTGYYGPFSVHEDEDGGYLIHHRTGQINPGGEVDAKRYYDLVDDKLILTPASETGMKRDANRQVVWQRLPDVELSEEAQRFLGHRELLYTDRYTVQDGEPVESGDRNEGRAGSVILYTPTGHMMVHLMAREGRTPYAGDTPTPEESMAAYQTYGGYFRALSPSHEDAGPALRRPPPGRQVTADRRGDGRRAALPVGRRRPAAGRPAERERGRRPRRRAPLLGADAEPGGVARQSSPAAPLAAQPSLTGSLLRYYGAGSRPERFTSSPRRPPLRDHLVVRCGNGGSDPARLARRTHCSAWACWWRSSG